MYFKKTILTFIVLIAIYPVCFAGVNVGVGGALLLRDKFWNPNLTEGGLSWDFSASYSFSQVGAGVEIFNNLANRTSYNPYNHYHIQPFLQFFPIKKIGLFAKGGLFLSAENRTLTYNELNQDGVREKQTLIDNGSWFGYGVSLGYRDRLIKNTNLYLNVELSYNDYLKNLTNNYYMNFLGERNAFYGFKFGLSYEFDLKKKNKQ